MTIYLDFAVYGGAPEDSFYFWNNGWCFSSNVLGVGLVSLIFVFANGVWLFFKGLPGLAII